MNHGLKRDDVATGDLVFAPDEKKAANDHGCWNVLIVDDDKEVHDVTELALRNFSFEAKRLRFFHAYTGAEAVRVMADNPDIAVVFLDVVMESDDAGLVAANRIRTELGNKLVRIVLRTGQAGLAPAQEVIVVHEINDYKTKTELTAQKLFTTLVASLRNYRDLVAIESNRQVTAEKLLTSVAVSLRNYRGWAGDERNQRDLENIGGSSGSGFEMPPMEQIIESVLTQARAVLHEQDAMSSRAVQAAAAGSTDTQAHQPMPAGMPTPKETADVEGDYSEYELTSPAETLSILRGMREIGSLITLYFNRGYDFVLTSLVDISHDGKTMILDYGSNMEMNRKALQADKINCTSSKDKVKIRFVLNGVRPIKHEGRDAFVGDVPDALFRLQRRENYRLSTPLANPLRANIPLSQEHGSGKTVQAVVLDISGGGICVVVPPDSVAFQPDAQFFGANINLPNVGPISVDIRVRNIYNFTTSNGKILQRIGCEFIKLPGPTMKLIQRYIIQVQRERNERGV